MKISKESEVKTMSTTKTDLLKTIRQKCLDCVCFQPREVELCPSEHCTLWPFRMGKDPYKTPRIPSPAQMESLAKAQAVRKQKKDGPEQ